MVMFPSNDTLGKCAAGLSDVMDIETTRDSEASMFRLCREIGRKSSDKDPFLRQL